MKTTIKVLSLFNGMNCIGLALNELGIKAQIYASEIEKYPTIISDILFPDTVNLGCVVFLRKAFCWKKEIIEKALNSKWIRESTKQKIAYIQHIKENIRFNIICAGSPCQGFSFAGKGLNFEDPRSKLFFEFVKILRELQEINPNVIFLLENVRMKKQHEDFISKTLGIEPIMINSSRLSAQNRERLYWTNICSKQGFFFKECAIKQPKDKGIFLKDILESEVDKKYFLNNKAVIGLLAHQKFNKFNPRETNSISKSSCITCHVSKNSNSENYIISNQGIRRLTPRECARLQTIPEWAIEKMLNCGVSDTQIYKMLGNGWTVDVIAYILSHEKLLF